MPGAGAFPFFSDINLNSNEAVDMRLHQITGVGDLANPLGGVIGFYSANGDKRIGFYDDEIAAMVKVLRHDRAESITGQWAYAPAAPQAPFTLAANAQGQLVTGLNADELDGYETSQSTTASTVAVRTATGALVVQDALNPTEAVNLRGAKALLNNGDDKKSVRCGSIAALPSNVFSNNILTGSINGALPALDGVSCAVDDIVAIMWEGGGGSNYYQGSANELNGLFKITALGAVDAKWTMERLDTADTRSEVTAGMFFFVSEGTQLGNSKWALVNDDPVILRVDGPVGLSATPASGGTLTQDITYYYRITPVDSSGEMATDEEISALTTSVNKTIDLAWSAFGAATSYKIYRSTTTDTYGATSYAGTTTGTTFQDTGITLTSGTPPTGTALQFYKFDSNSYYTEGNGIDISGDVVSLKVNGTDTFIQHAILYANTTTTIDGDADFTWNETVMTVKGSGMANAIKIGQNSSPTYGLISFNGDVTDAGKLGFTGGGGSGLNLYYDVPTGGSHNFRENAGTNHWSILTGTPHTWQGQGASVVSTSSGDLDVQPVLNTTIAKTSGDVAIGANPATSNLLRMGKDQNAVTRFSISNANNGTAASTGIVLGTNAGSEAMIIQVQPENYTGTGDAKAWGGMIRASYSGGLSLTASHASGTIQFYAGGFSNSELRWTMTAATLQAATTAVIQTAAGELNVNTGNASHLRLSTNSVNRFTIFADASTIVGNGDTIYGSSGGTVLIQTTTSAKTVTIAPVSGSDFIVTNAGDSGTAITSSATASNAFTVTADSLIAGGVARFYSNSSSATARRVVDIINDHASATGATTLKTRQDSTGYNVWIQQDGILAAGRNALYVYSNAIQANAELFFLHNDHTSSTADTSQIRNDGKGKGAYIFQVGVLASSKYALHVDTNAAHVDAAAKTMRVSSTNAASTSGMVFFDNAGTGTVLDVRANGVLAASNCGLYVYSNAVQVTGRLMEFHMDSTSSTQDLSYFLNDGTGSSIYINQVGILAAGKNALRVYSNGVQANSPIVEVIMEHVDSTAGLAYYRNDGSGICLTLDCNHGTNTAFKIDSEGVSTVQCDWDFINTSNNILEWKNAGAQTGGSFLYMSQDHASTTVPVAKFNQAGTGDIIQGLDGGTVVFKLTDGGEMELGTGANTSDLLRIGVNQDNYTRMNINNANTGTSSRTGLSFGNNTTTEVCRIDVQGSGWSGGAAYEVANGTSFVNTQTGGMNIGAVHASGSLTFLSGGAQRAIFTTGGKFGVGDLAPNDTIQAVGTITSQHNVASNTFYDLFACRSSRGIDDYGGLDKQYLKFRMMTDGAGTNGRSSNHTYGHLALSLVDAADTTFHNHFVWDAAGLFGIGTLDPIAKLHVAHTATVPASVPVTWGVAFNRIGNNTGSWSSAVTIQSGGTSYIGSSVLYMGHAANYAFNGIHSQYSGNTAGDINAFFNFQVAGADRMRLRGNGDLALGNSIAPVTHVNHRFIFLGTNGIGSINSAAAEMQISSNTYIDAAGSRAKTVGSIATTLYEQTGGFHKWWTGAGAGAADDPASMTARMTLSNAGVLTVAGIGSGLVQSASGALGLNNDLPVAATIGTKKIARIYTANLAGTGKTHSVNHDLNQLDPIVMVKDTATGFIGAAQFDVTDADNVEVKFVVTPTSGQFDVIIVG